MPILSPKCSTNLLANLVSMLLVLITIIYFSRAYFSYACILFILFFLYGWLTRKKNHQSFLCYFQPIRPLLITFMLFYIFLLIDSIILIDRKSIFLTMDYASFLIPFFMFYFLYQQYRVDIGIKWGILIGSFIICIGGVWTSDPRFFPRTSSFFNHPNDFGTIIALLLPFVFYYTWKSKYLLEKSYCISIFFLLLICLYRTESRGAMMSLGAAISITILLLIIQYWKRFNRSNIYALIILGFLTFSLGIGSVYHISSDRSGLGVIGGERVMMIESSYHMWSDHKLFGVGIANWGENYYSETYHPKNGQEKGHSMPHNMLIYFLSTSGLLGGVAYLAFLFMFFWILLKSLRGINDIFLFSAVMITFLSFTIHGLVDATTINKVPSRIFYTLMGYYFAIYSTKKTSDNAFPCFHSNP